MEERPPVTGPEMPIFNHTYDFLTWVEPALSRQNGRAAILVGNYRGQHVLREFRRRTLRAAPPV
jgi:hypothetical protein